MTTLLRTQHLISDELVGLLSDEANSSQRSASEASSIRGSHRFERLQSVDYNLSENDIPSVGRRQGLNMFLGVFCPVALSQFSSLLFLRMGFAVGQAGVINFSIQLLLAYAILMLTVLSISAISTNGQISAGGVYYMISRTLGPEFGGSIGLLFFFANVFACGLYLSGLTEGLVENFGPNGNISHVLPGDARFWKYLYSVAMLLLCLALCLLGSSLVAKTSAVVLCAVLVCFTSSLASIYFRRDIEIEIPRTNRFVYKSANTSTVSYNCTGPSADTLVNNALSHYTFDYTATTAADANVGFVKVFAVLFSSVTGIMNGANLSGELRKPSHAIPTGTLLATTFTFTIYLLYGLSLGSSCEHELLANNNYFLLGVNIWPPFVLIGIAATALSAALGNLIGASRILHALARDKLFGAVLKPAAYATDSGNPLLAVLISFALVLVVLLIGSLNTIAPIVSCFFLLSYASTNLSCFALDVAAAPNFRPKFKLFHWSASLVGVAGCAVMSFLVSNVYTPVSLFIMLALMVLLHLRDLPHDWGSISQALIYHQVRKYLLKLDSRKSHVKYWRPQILLLVANPRSSSPVIDFVNDLKKGGLFVISHVFVGEFDAMSNDPSETELPAWLSLVDHLKVKAFVELTVSSSVRSGMQQLLRISGLGGMKPNIVCFGFYDNVMPVDDLLAAVAAANSADVGVDGVLRDDNADTETAATAAEAAATNKLLSVFPEPRTEATISSSTAAAAAAAAQRHVQNSTEWCRMVQDAVRMHKSVLLTRNMTGDSSSRLRQRSSRGSDGSTRASLIGRTFGQTAATSAPVDAWLVDFLRPAAAGVVDNSGLLLLQLACVLRMVPRWHHSTHLRVFLCCPANSNRSEQLSLRLKGLLDEMRIEAETVLLSWEQVLCSDGDASSTVAPPPPAADAAAADWSEYLTRVNRCIRANGEKTVLTLLCLAPPPQSESKYGRYHHELDLLTRDLPPTVLVHGVSKVFSRKL